MDVAQDLKWKRAKIEERIGELTAQIAEARETVAALDRVLSLYDPAWADGRPGTQHRASRKAKSEATAELDRIIGGTNKRRMTLEILRTAGRPLSTHECAAAFAARHELPADHPGVPTITNRLSSTLNILEKQGLVRHAETDDPRRRNWEIA
ncbi:hypothetical protein [uncultured Aureimonas sp.]|uniref:hypothetical protein n=1 Tax=uncultured Aureimonas sp. TaxID=1604662 RepID=UPI0025D38C7D|nr:hypothetical protein [uncultured Aureimonas sp.]